MKTTGAIVTFPSPIEFYSPREREQIADTLSGLAADIKKGTLRRVTQVVHLTIELEDAA